MRVRLPLIAKLMGWFFLNLLLLLLTGWLLLHFQFKDGVNSFLAGYIANRLEPSARGLMEKLNAAPSDQWDAIVREHSAKAGVDFAVYGMGQRRLAGPEWEVPDVVIKRMPRPPGRGGPDAAPATKNDDSKADGDFRPERPPEISMGAKAGPGVLAPMHDRFLIQTSDPTTYWVGMFTALNVGGRPGGRPVILLAKSATLSAGGAFLDYRPWVLTVGALLALCVLFWLPFVRGLTRSISKLSTATDQIAEGRFDIRVDETRRDELGQLGGAINRMSSRLEGYVHGQKQFLGDTAHELCAPISRMQMAIGILEQRADAQQKPYVEDVQEELQNMSHLVNELLSFSKAAMRSGNVELESLELRPLIDRVVAREAIPEVAVRVEVPAGLKIKGNGEMLFRAFSNLLRNANRYAGHAGHITFDVDPGTRETVVMVRDRGPGIPESEHERIFDPFYRLEKDRDRQTGGAGLGLTIVKACVEASGGTVKCRNRKSGGLEMRVTLATAT
ncbi:MAG TPA: HAMP domain-containing sensor histidine kinase [Roseimicrobium sp.]|nr:HAMP domain-containing sensor histidine kinase [Roseimicrobium sp.]